MKNNNVVIPHFILAIAIIDQVSALFDESIVGGYRANRESFKYHLEIQVRNNYSNQYLPRCGGAFLSGFIGIAAAHCFMKANGNLENVSFSIMAGTDVLNDYNALYVDIDVIYRLKEYEPVTLNDIVLFKFKREINIKVNPKLCKLELPKSEDSFSSSTGVIAGYGYNWVVTKRNKTTELPKFITGGRFENLLRYANVKILKENEVKFNYSYIDLTKIFYGIMISENNESWGPCLGDSGNVLVLNNTAIGIFIGHHIDCDDNDEGSIYVKISAYIDFIKSVMSGKISSDTLSFSNPSHTLIEELDKI